MDDEDRFEGSDDAALLHASQRASAAFRVFYDRHATRLHGSLLRRTGDPQAALELTAETFARAWLARGRFVDRGEGAAPWLFGIARNVLAASIRERAITRKARREVGLEAAADVIAPREDWLTSFDEELAAVLAELPEGQRRAIEMRVMDGAGYDVVARDLGSSPAAARVRVHRGLAALRRALSARGAGPGSDSLTATRPEGDLP